MAGNQVVLSFAGETKDLETASKKASDAIESVGDGADSASSSFQETSKQSSGLVDKMGKLGAATSGFSDAIENAGGLLSDLNQIQSQSYEKAQAHARALNDVTEAENDTKQAAEDLRQAQRDLNQSFIDGDTAALDYKQAQIDLKQANLDVSKAQVAYNTAVKQHGANSAEAQQASIDLANAQQEVTQANIDGRQATEDGKQATEDGRQAQIDSTQATVDGKNAQLDLNDAMREARPPELEKWGQDLETVTPLLTAIPGIIALVTAAQWLWNAALTANPIGIIVVGIGLIIAGLVLLATKTHVFQDAWSASWGAIKKAASSTWDFLKQIPGWLQTAFGKVAGVISAPYRAAFNLIADAWNHTIGALHFTVPGWVPGLGGDSISVPNLPHFHSGGTVGGTPGSEVLAVLQAGETVSPATSSGATTVALPRGALVDGDKLVEIISRASRGRVGGVQLVLGGRSG